MSNTRDSLVDYLTDLSGLNQTSSFWLDFDVLTVNAANIKDVYNNTQDVNKSSLRERWNRYVREKASRVVEDLQSQIEEPERPFSDTHIVMGLLLDAALIGFGWYLSGWTGVGIGIVAAIGIAIHYNQTADVHNRSVRANNLFRYKIQRTHAYILGWCLGESGNFVREEAPWEHPTVLEIVDPNPDGI